MKLDFRIEIFKEAKVSLKEAVELFLEECKSMGTLDDVLTEAGFKPKNGPGSSTNKQWHSNDPLVTERMALGF